MLPESARLQGEFGVLTGLFDQVGLRTNKVKTVSMACRPCHIPHVWSTEAYTRLVMVQGLSYMERLSQRVRFPKFGFNLASGSPAAHQQLQNGFWSGKVTPPPP